MKEVNKKFFKKNINSFKLKIVNNKKFLLFTAVIVVVAIIPRITEVLSGNYIFLFDQGDFYLNVKKIVVDHKPTLIGIQVGGAGGFFQGAGWIYLLSIPFLIFGGNPYGGMILMFIIGITTVIFSIFTLRSLFGWQEAVLTGYLIAVSPNIIEQSRFIWPPFPISLLSVFYLYFIYKIFQGKKAYIGHLGFVIGLMSHFEVATAGSLFTLSALIIIFLILKKFISWKSSLRFLIGTFLPFIPLLIFDIRHNFLNVRGVLSMLNVARNSQEAGNLFGDTVMNHLAIFSTSFSSMTPYVGNYWQIIAFFLLLGVILFLTDKKQAIERKLFVFFLAFSPILLFIIFLFYRSHMWNWWILELYIFYCFLAGIVVIYLSKKHIIGKFLLFAMIVYFSGIYYFHTINAYTRDYSDYGGTAKIKGKIDAIDYIYKQSRGKEFGMIVFTPPVYTYAYDYLIWWYGQKKYNYIPHKEKKGTFYLLIEKDPGKPWSYEGWLKTVIKSGKIEWTRELPSGFIVQKRISN